MKNLKLNQKLLVNSSCYFRGEIFKFEKTRLENATKTEDGYRVKMTRGHWGACPTRDKSEVVANENDIDRIVDKFFTAQINRMTVNIGQGKGNTLLIVEDKDRGQVVVRYISFNKSEETMRDGKYDEYYISQFAGSCTIRIKNGRLPNGVFDSVEKAEKRLRELLSNSL